MLNESAAMLTDPLAQVAYLRSPHTIRERCTQLFEMALGDRLSHFQCDPTRLEPTADYVLRVMRQHYPDLDIPFHSRWRHFEVGNPSRLAHLEQSLIGLTPIEKARAQFDLAIVSVLLDAGAGAAWHYTETSTSQTFGRSEGLAIASFWMMCQGIFSSDRAHPLQVNADALQKITAESLATGFQVTTKNPLVGLSGRTQLLQQLGYTLPRYPHLFGTQSPRPGLLVDYLLTRSRNGTLAAVQVLSAVLEGFSDIWSGRLTLANINLGDVWTHSALNTSSPQDPSSQTLFSSLIPFHKLSQWLTYSLLEPLQALGLEIIGLDELTGLPEYRNGGLCIDLELLQVKDPALLQQPQLVSSEAIVEWRALTVILLDRIADTIRQKLGMTAIDLPLVKILQGGTWTAGRQIAAELRPGGTPPLQIESDGTVF
ncbi:URC4/urg3 family protein [Phormidium sp. CLA17]|uniref:URC4/urg3 family protein n=1 Tax=Leptolyngbya sp. Cla-17 TaxID=2803751 RepID=UPI001492CDC8|nr:URC4/urg3 family protein [Leptolyngbya sp. Cla-17]MBM0742987.1 URC4/urg3 family protein [Leptolyngbya sp. Cla-17]